MKACLILLICFAAVYALSEEEQALAQLKQSEDVDCSSISNVLKKGTRVYMVGGYTWLKNHSFE